MTNVASLRLFDSCPIVIPFLTAGFPTKRLFLEVALATYESGARAIEVGMPFSDPLADGPAIQQSSQIALERGMTLHMVLELTATLRAHLPIPIFLMGYLNPLLAMGFDKFAASAKSAGATGTIIPDCPIEEAGEWLRASKRARLDNIFLIAPTSADDRIKRIDNTSTHFSYCVSVAGVTGARSAVSDQTKTYLRRVRRLARKPYVVGFGISRPEHVRALHGLARGFVIGSALVPLLQRGKRGTAAVGRLMSALVRAAG